MTETRAAIDKLKAAQKRINQLNSWTNSDSFTKNEVEDYKQHTLHKRML
jgi:hypothetical protein